MNDLNLLSFSPFGGNGLQHHRRRSYIPSPLGSPAAARRLGQRLGDRLCSSPILSRVKKKWKDGEDQVGWSKQCRVVRFLISLCSHSAHTAYPNKGAQQIKHLLDPDEFLVKVKSSEVKIENLSEVLISRFRGDRLSAAFWEPPGERAALAASGPRVTRLTTSWLSTFGGRRATPAGSPTDTPRTSGMRGE